LKPNTDREEALGLLLRLCRHPLTIALADILR
jgi:hypothetical protein